MPDSTGFEPRIVPRRSGTVSAHRHVPGRCPWRFSALCVIQCAYVLVIQQNLLIRGHLCCFVRTLSCIS